MRKASFFALLIAAATSASAQTPHLLVVNQGDVTVSVVDPVTNKQTSVIDEHQSGVHGHEAAVASDPRIAFVPIYGSTGVGKPGIDGHEILVIDWPTGVIKSHIDFGRGVRPHCAVYDPVSGHLYVTTELDKTVTIIDPKTLQIVGAIPTGQEQSHMLVVSHDGKRGYTANVGPGTVSVLDLAARKTLAIIPISSNTQRIAISNDDKYVFTSDQTSGRMAVISTATNTVVKWIALPGNGYGPAATHDGHRLLVPIPTKDIVAVIDLATMTVARTIPVGKTPQEVLIRPDGLVAYVSAVGAKSVTAIDLREWKSVASIETGNSPDGLAWAR